MGHDEWTMRERIISEMNNRVKISTELRFELESS